MRLIATPAVLTELPVWRSFPVHIELTWQCCVISDILKATWVSGQNNDVVITPSATRISIFQISRRPRTSYKVLDSFDANSCMTPMAYFTGVGMERPIVR